MLEALVSSRIRRTLFEHVLAHPDERFYLRGLAKTLSVSVSPLRRELKRLERSGLLSASQEGNIVFYLIKTDSPLFLQLQQAGQTAVRTAAPQESSLQNRDGVESRRAVQTPSQPSASRAQSGPLDAMTGQALGSAWRSPLNSPALMAAAGVGMALILMVAGLLYLTVTNRRLASVAARAVTTRSAEIAVVAHPPSASGTMRGTRWQVVPGGFGGFGAGSAAGDSF